VRIGSTPPLARSAAVVGTLPSNAPLDVAVTLNPSDPAGLAAYAQAVSTPGSSVYHQYLTTAQFADRFGATEDQVQAVQSNLRAHGLAVGPVSPNRLSIPVTGTAAQVGRAFSVSFRKLSLSRGRTATVASAAPALDEPIAGYVQGVIGLSSLNQFHPQLARRAIPAPRHSGLVASARHAATGGPQPCPAASSAASQQGAYTADQIASTYGFSSLYQGGSQGQGKTVAIYELEPNDPADIGAYQSCYGTHASVSYIPVNGGSGSGEGSGEAALDIENAIGLAPKASYLVYQGANSNSSAPGSGPYETFNAIISQNRAQVVSVSWGECEADNTDGLQAENTLFQEAATQGQSIVAASGDQGSEDCFSAPPSIPDLSLTVDDPSSQPFVTGVGGTTLNDPGPPPSETTWNNGPIPGLAGNGGAGGGGTSGTWQIPPYQSGAAASLHVVKSGSREVPDVSVDADPNTGYVVYWNGSGSDPLSTVGWQSIAGTSAAAPVMAALLAVVDSASACRAAPAGFANPALYQAAGSDYGATFHDVTSGNNDLFSAHGGQFAAGSGYDMATGLGTPIAGGLASTLCSASSASPRVANPGSQKATVGKSVSVRLRTLGAVSGRVTWHASRLPPGLSISSSTGRISGKPRRVGIYSVAVSATAQGIALREAVFKWTVAGLPSISQASLTGVGARRPTLSLSVASGSFAPALKTVAIAVPTGLQFAARKGSVSVTGAGAKRVKFSSRVVRGRLQITLASPQAKIALRIRYAAISSTSGLAGRVRSHSVRTLLVTVTATDTARHASTTKAKVRAA
jgi:subtilase family serine protease